MYAFSASGLKVHVCICSKNKQIKQLFFSKFHSYCLHKCAVCTPLSVSHTALIGMQFTSIWFDRDKLLVWLWNAPLESIMKGNQRKPAVDKINDPEVSPDYKQYTEKCRKTRPE